MGTHVLDRLHIRLVAILLFAIGLALAWYLLAKNDGRSQSATTKPEAVTPKPAPRGPASPSPTASRLSDPAQAIPRDASRFAKAHVDKNGDVSADGIKLKLYGILLPARQRICVASTGARWTCGHRAYIALHNLIDARPIVCDLKGTSGELGTLCWLQNADISRSLLLAGWGEAAPGIMDQSYLSAQALAKSRKIGIWSDGPPQVP